MAKSKPKTDVTASRKIRASYVSPKSRSQRKRFPLDISVKYLGMVVGQTSVVFAPSSTKNPFNSPKRGIGNKIADCIIIPEVKFREDLKLLRKGKNMFHTHGCRKLQCIRAFAIGRGIPPGKTTEYYFIPNEHIYVFKSLFDLYLKPFATKEGFKLDIFSACLFDKEFLKNKVLTTSSHTIAELESCYCVGLIPREPRVKKEKKPTPEELYGLKAPYPVGGIGAVEESESEEEEVSENEESD